MAVIEKKSLEAPDETRTFVKGRADIVNLGGATLGRVTAEPGWRWSECVKPIVHTANCQVHHTGYVAAGRMRVVMDDGTEQELGPNDAYVIPPGHDAWVIGDEPLVAFDFTGAATYAKPA